METDMLSFKQFTEELKLPQKTLGVSRSIMPQVRAKHMDTFIKHLKNNDVKVKQTVLNPKKLKAIQGEFDQEKIKINMEKLKTGPLKPIIVSSDNYVIDGNHRWLAAMNAGVPIVAYKANTTGKTLLKITNKFKKVKRNALGEAFELMCDSSVTDALMQYSWLIAEQKEVCPILTVAHMQAFEKFVDRMFEKFGIDFDFTKHFRERMSDERNDPCIDMKELAAMIQKIYRRKVKGDNFLSKHKDAEIVIKDLQSDLNMPVAIEYDRKNDEIRIVSKTIMRKKNFRTPNPVVKV
jgi:hypothetical protein